VFDDKDSIGADSHPNSPFRDNVYVAWSKFTGLGNSGKGNSFGSVQIVFSRSTDGGKTWSNPIPLSQAHNNNVAGGRQGSQIGVGPDGTVYVVWTDTVKKLSVERMAISRDGGASFGQSLVIAQAPSEVPAALPGAGTRSGTARASTRRITEVVTWLGRTYMLTGAGKRGLSSEPSGG